MKRRFRKPNSSANGAKNWKRSSWSARSPDSWPASGCAKCFLARIRTRKLSPSEEQVAAYKRDELLALYRDFYTPENGLLLLVGDFQPDAMLKSVEKVFGAWQGKKPETKSFAAPANPRGRRVYLVHLPGAVQTQILAGCHAITRKHPDWVKLGLTNSLYGGAFNSRLVMNIREDKGYTYSPRSGVQRVAAARILFGFGGGAE